jgi:hypothetical protein
MVEAPSHKTDVRFPQTGKHKNGPPHGVARLLIPLATYSPLNSS